MLDLSADGRTFLGAGRTRMTIKLHPQDP